MKWSKGQSISYCGYDGPIFGGKEYSRDLYISSNKSGYSDLGHSYTHPDYSVGSNEARSFLAGSHHFEVLEIEVYTKRI